MVGLWPVRLTNTDTHAENNNFVISCNIQTNSAFAKRIQTVTEGFANCSFFSAQLTGLSQTLDQLPTQNIAMASAFSSLVSHW